MISILFTKISRMREKDCPVITNKFVKSDITLCSLCFKIYFKWLIVFTILSFTSYQEQYHQVEVTFIISKEKEAKKKKKIEIFIRNFFNNRTFFRNATVHLHSLSFFFSKDKAFCIFHYSTKQARHFIYLSHTKEWRNHFVWIGNSCKYIFFMRSHLMYTLL